MIFFQIKNLKLFFKISQAYLIVSPLYSVPGKVKEINFANQKSWNIYVLIHNANDKILMQINEGIIVIEPRQVFNQISVVNHVFGGPEPG